MGLFGKKESVKPQAAARAPQQAKVRYEYDTKWTNLTDKMMRVELVSDKVRIEPVLIQADDNHIRLICQGILIAEVGKRGKAYQELEPLVGQTADIVEIEARNGDYGPYYHAALKFKSTVIEMP